MSGRRIVQSAINWSALAERVPPNQMASFMNFKTRSDIYVRTILAIPETAPIIDWNYYKDLVPTPGLVDEFQKQYDALTVPYPADNFTSLVEAEIKETKSEIDSFKKNSEQRVGEMQEKIDQICSELPFDEMTMEDYRDAFPDLAMDSAKRPTFWPHNEEEQAGYTSREMQDAWDAHHQQLKNVV